MKAQMQRWRKTNAYGSIKDTLREMQEDLQSSISYAGGKDLNSIKLVDYVIVKNTIMDGDY